MKSARWGLACLFLSLAVMPLVAQSPLPERRNYQCLTAEQKKTFLDAFNVLKQRDPAKDSWSHPYDNSLQFYIQLHNGPGEGDPSTCTHDDERFLTWHRVLLHLFEFALRRASPDPTFTLPYWNWSNEPTGKHYPKEFETNPDLLAIRSDDPNLRVRFTEAQILEIINDNSSFVTFAGGAGFGGAWETQRHNTMHTWVGGAREQGPMYSDTTAAVDPLFWLFHAYVDLVFDTWQRKYHYPPLGCANCTLQVLPGWTPAMVDRTEMIGYVYDGTICPAPTVTESLFGEAAASMKTLPMLTRMESVLEATPRSAEQPITFEITVPPAGFDIAELRFKGAERPSDFSYRVGVYLHPTNVAAAPGDAAFRQKYRVAELTIWALSSAASPEHAGHPKQNDLYVNATTELRYLAKTAPDSRWRVTFAVEETMPRKGTATADTAQELKRRITIEGVDLVLDRGVR
jgi:hypothetical protein